MDEGRLRVDYGTELQALEKELLDMGLRVRLAFADAVQALKSGNADASNIVIADGADVDRRYEQIERTAFDLLALQAPVAGDLRLIVAVLHVCRHLERIGDAAVNIARLTILGADLPSSHRILEIIDMMGTEALGMVDEAVRALADRDANVVVSFADRDEAVDRLGQEMFWETLADADDPRRLEWALRMHQASRHLKRAADYAVDIAEQVAFLVAGDVASPARSVPA